MIIQEKALSDYISELLSNAVPKAKRIPLELDFIIVAALVLVMYVTNL